MTGQLRPVLRPCTQAGTSQKQGPSCHRPTPSSGKRKSGQRAGPQWHTAGSWEEGRGGTLTAKREGCQEVWPSGHRVGTTRLGGLSEWARSGRVAGPHCGWTSCPILGVSVGLTPPGPCSVGSWAQTRGSRGAPYSGSPATRCPLPRAAGLPASRVPQRHQLSLRGDAGSSHRRRVRLRRGGDFRFGNKRPPVPESSEWVRPLRPPRGSRSH